MHRRVALLFFKVICQISRSHWPKNRSFWPELSVSELYHQFKLTDGYAMMHKSWSGIKEMSLFGVPISIKATEVLVDQSFRYNDVIMSAMGSQITTSGFFIQPFTASLAFLRWIHRSPVNSPHKGPVTRKMFPFDDAIMFRDGSRFAPSQWERALLFSAVSHWLGASLESDLLFKVLYKQT